MTSLDESHGEATMTSTPTYDGVRAVVTGGGSGIGAATARLLHQGGADVACLDLDPAGAPAGCRRLTGDVSDPGISMVVEDAVRQLGGLDVLVNNAGVGATGTVEDTDDEVFRRLYEVNVLGAVRVARAALPALRDSRAAVVVNTCSVAAQVGLPQRVAYSASKGALWSLTLAMAADHLADGIRVCGVAPGTADTPWVQRLLDAAEDPSAERAALEARQPTGRLVSAEEVAETICFLASTRSASTTGTVVTVDGGLSFLRLPQP
jgi:NAD(P)-dependent dehydrogenase (short-subunit alcohol dehydrogenase family)